MKPMTKNILKTASALLIAAAGSASAKTEDADANARLAFSDKLSMYSQRIAGSACAFTSEDAPYESRGFLAVAGHEVNRILRALENGDRALGISTPEQNDVILEQLEETRNEWNLVYAISDQVLRGEKSESTLSILETRNDSFADNAFRLVGLISNQYTDTDSLLLSDAVRLQIAGRQRMLSQKMSFEACKYQKTGDPAALEALKETHRLFELSALALRTGMPEVGLIPTTEPELVEKLEDVRKLWVELKWPLMALEAGTAWDSTTQARMYLKLNELMHETDQAVTAYTKAVNAKG